MLPYHETNIVLPTEIKPAEILLYFWKHDKWSNEKTSYIKSNSIEKNIQTISHLYFRLLDDEAIIHHDITVNNVVLHANKQIAFISLNQSPFLKQDSTKDKLMIIEGLLKTLQSNNIAVPLIQFLVNHQSIDDDHLDFTVPWPIQGYL